jgi:hypothetical protein
MALLYKWYYPKQEDDWDELHDIYYN